MVHIRDRFFYKFLYTLIEDFEKKKKFEKAKNDINLIVGKTGSGKTLYAVSEIVRLVEEGFTVFTNIELDYKNVYTLEKLQYHLHFKNEGDVALVVDESNSVFIDEVPLDLKRYLAQTRKKGGVKWFFISQDYRLLNPEIRRFCHFVHVPRKKFYRFFTVDVYEQEVFEQAYQIGGVSLDKRATKKRTWKFYDWKITSLFDSFAFVNVDLL